MDFSQRIAIDTMAMDWVPSPHAGVWRKPLAREEAERGHATSIVRYDAGASFHGHNHPLGEEILVLDGTFSDETGDFHAGTYFRNPPGFIHAPFSKEGCTILVKLHQMQAEDVTRVAIDTNQAEWLTQDNGARILPLHKFENEKVFLLDVPAGTPFQAHTHDGGEEVYLLKGRYHDEYGSYGPGSWIRMPPGSSHTTVIDEDSLVWLKAGHLPA